MTKLVLILSFIGLALLLTVGMIDPNNAIMWLASTSENFQIIRSGLLLVIFSLLVTEPPRNVVLRMIVGTISVGLLGWGAAGVWNNALPVMDGLLFLSVGLAAGITVLERNTYPEEFHVALKESKKSSKRKLATA